ncbi:hypothetical protein CEXT_442031 [Caerostris extrusa]|uniref:Uncharacterized protein n=1 Tax=Caerostris extrusa TaxID=172846 RepID=A0AAV4Y7G5_CAEEX|nr:hypothetical protein CEXT_442031 [Caerostris extrusa]
MCVGGIQVDSQSILSRVLRNNSLNFNHLGVKYRRLLSNTCDIQGQTFFWNRGLRISHFYFSVSSLLRLLYFGTPTSVFMVPAKARHCSLHAPNGAKTLLFRTDHYRFNLEWIFFRADGLYRSGGDSR